MEECVFVPPALPSARSLVDAVDDEVTCAICYDLLQEPKALACGHVYDGDCIAQWVQQQRTAGLLARCPTCQHPIAAEFVARSVLQLKNFVDRIRIYACGACGETVRWNHLEPGKCPSRRLRHLKCGQVFPEKELRSHMDALCPVLYPPPRPIAPVDEEEKEPHGDGALGHGRHGGQAAAAPAAVAAAVESDEDEKVQPANDLQPRLTSLLPHRMPARLFTFLSVMAWLALALVLVGLSASDPQSITCRLSSRLPFNTTVLGGCLPYGSFSLSPADRIRELEFMLAREHRNAASLTGQLDQAGKTQEQLRAGLRKEKVLVARLSLELRQAAFQMSRVNKTHAADTAKLQADLGRERRQSDLLVKEAERLRAQPPGVEKIRQQERDDAASKLAEASSQCKRETAELQQQLQSKASEAEGCEARFKAWMNEEPLRLQQRILATLDQERLYIWGADLTQEDLSRCDAWACQQLGDEPSPWLSEQHYEKRRLLCANRLAECSRRNMLHVMIKESSESGQAVRRWAGEWMAKAADMLEAKTDRVKAEQERALHEQERAVWREDLAKCNGTIRQLLETKERDREAVQEECDIRLAEGRWVGRGQLAVTTKRSGLGKVEQTVAQSSWARRWVDCDERLAEAHVSHVEEVEELEAEVRRVKLQCISGQQ